MNYCHSCGIYVSERQLQRDLNSLSDLVNDKNETLEITTEHNNKKKYKISVRH